MAFERLETDEAYDGPPVKPSDFDGAMIVGVLGFVLTAVGVYVSCIWPWYVFDHAEVLQTVLICALVGLIPAVGIAYTGIRRTGIAACCGAAAGALVVAVFVFLRLQQTFTAFEARQAPRPDYPGWVMAALPFLLFAVVSAFSISQAMRLPSSKD